ncbi:helix-turn-helix transcriptional regulator [Robiginitalea biformata]|uniref:helix-turn-helix transcriptional regulator n=1 Tax=Robiginitalea biformata TaxID=252307 RepID=UPI003B58BBED
MKRLDRLVAILMRLQTRRVVPARELADRFQVSLRTIYRDIRSLEASGVPISGESGVGYSIMEGYRLPPVMFTREEAGSFVAAEKLMGHFTDASTRRYFESALSKIRAVLRMSDKDWMQSLEGRIHIQPGTEPFNQALPDALERLFESIAERRQIFLRYQAIRAGEFTQRYIEPVGLFHENGFWYVYAYCHLRADYRQFRTDRIRVIHATDKPFTRDHMPLDTFLKGRHGGEKTRVRILVDKEVARFLEATRKRHGFLSEQDQGDKVELIFETSWLKHDFARWYLTFGDHAEILEPEALREHVRELLSVQMAKLKQ